MYGTDYEYASSRLSGTIVRLNDEPVIIDDVHVHMKVTFAKLSNIKEVFECNLEELNLKPVPLGMCNFKGVVTYLTRMPMRRDWKQGLRRGNFISLVGFPAEVILPEALDQVIKGTYPTYKECINALKEDGKLKQIAWAREWAITDQGEIWYKGEGVVGVVNNDEPLLHHNYQYLRESLQETL